MVKFNPGEDSMAAEEVVYTHLFKKNTFSLDRARFNAVWSGFSNTECDH